MIALTADGWSQRDSGFVWFRFLEVAYRLVEVNEKITSSSSGAFARLSHLDTVLLATSLCMIDGNSGLGEVAAAFARLFLQRQGMEISRTYNRLDQICALGGRLCRMRIQQQKAEARVIWKF